MTVGRLLLRLLVVPIGAVLAACAAAAVAFVGNWNVFVSGAPFLAPDGDGDVVPALIGFVMLVIGSASTFPMLLPGTIGIAISEMLAIRSFIFHVLNGVVSIWVGRTLVLGPERALEFQDPPVVVLAAGVAAGLVYWLIAGSSAGLASPVANPAKPPARTSKMGH